MSSDAELRAKAEKIANEKVGFYIHFAVYLAVNAFFAVIWVATSEGELEFPWFIFMTAAWGIGIVAHFVGVFAGVAKIDSMAQKEYERLKRQQGGT